MAQVFQLVRAAPDSPEALGFPMRVLGALLFGCLALAQNAEPPSVTMEQRVEILQLRQNAFKTLVRRTDDERQLQEALKQAAQSELAERAEQKTLDDINSKIDAKVKEVRKLCMADEKEYDLTDNFEWVKRGKK
jgi:hypothetical protein